MHTDTLDPEQSPIAPPVILPIPSQLGTATSSTPNTKQKRSPNTLVPGKNSVPLKKLMISLEMDLYGSFKPPDICPEISSVVVVLRLENGLSWEVIVRTVGNPHRP